MAITKVINDLIDLNQTGDYSGIRLPAGTTADRTNPPSGAMRYNTTTKRIEFYNGAWIEIATL